MNVKIYILLPVHNRHEATLRFIECLKVQTFQNFHLILIDDGSCDGTAEMVRGNVHSLTVLRGKGDWWWAGSLQQGYRWLQEQNVPAQDFVLIINDDTEFETDFLANALALLRNIERSLLLAQCYSRQTGRLLDVGVSVNWDVFSFEQAKKTEEINCLSTRGLFMKVADFIEIGGFHPILLPHYASDYEFTIRAHRMGMKLVSDASCRLRVDESTTGNNELYGKSFPNSLWRLFSRRSVNNPFMWSAFIALSCPFVNMPQNLFNVWWNYLATVNKIIRYWIIHRKIKLGASVSPLLVIVGAGGVCQKGWLSTDIEHLNLLKNEDWGKYFTENSIDAILAEHVWEHFTEEDGISAALNCFSYLKPGGYIRIAVPDGFHPSEEYREAVKPDGYGSGSDDHKVLYNYSTLITVLNNAGFDAELLEYFDENGSFHNKLWDSEDGHVNRSHRYDRRNKDNKLTYTSLILDARKRM